MRGGSGEGSLYDAPLIRPSGTFSRKGRRHTYPAGLSSIEM